jgi:hypothetical protein
MAIVAFFFRQPLTLRNKTGSAQKPDSESISRSFMLIEMVNAVEGRAHSCS